MDEQPTAIGVDLAWGERNQTGLCVVAGSRVIDSGALRTDEEIVGFVRPWLSPTTIVAVDAPLVVPNLSGQRPAERLVATLFGAAGGSAHSANRSRPNFVDGGRGARLARTLGLSVDPAAPLPVMIEVYPHPALIALFGLDRVLAYKGKAGRELGDRRTVFRVLLDYLETLGEADPALDVTTAPRWPSIRSEVATAERQVDLDRLEDEIDAYVCAYVGLHRLRWGDERSAVLGSLAEGYIVTPLDSERMARFRAPERGDTAKPRPTYRGHEARVVAAFRGWLESEGWTIVIEPTSRADLVAVRGSERMVGEAKGFTGPSTGLDIDTLYGQLLRRMGSETATTWAVIVPGEAVSAALRVPRTVRDSLGIVVYEVTDDGVTVRDD
jgi:predicted RNase H-like nuclease